MILPKPLTWSGTERIGLFHFLADNSCDNTETMHIGDFGASPTLKVDRHISDRFLPVFVIKLVNRY